MSEHVRVFAVRTPALKAKSIYRRTHYTVKGPVSRDSFPPPILSSINPVERLPTECKSVEGFEATMLTGITKPITVEEIWCAAPVKGCLYCVAIGL